MIWIKTLLFLVISFFIYYNIGIIILEKMNFSKKSVPKSIVLGFFIVYFVNFIVAFPLQVLQVSWLVYFISLSIVYVVGLIYVFKLRKEALKASFNTLKNNFGFAMIIRHLKKYWILYTIAFVLSMLSMANQFPYYSMNYDDAYYIGKVTNLINSPNLLNENYYNGSFTDAQSLIRYFNTYELGYGYFSTIFNIKVTFFCRATLVIHNYLLILLCYFALTSQFFDEKKAQYALLPFSLFFITFGYLNGVEFIQMYDGWQFQSAIFYGSSIVRVMGIPLIMLFGYRLLEKFSTKDFLLVVILSLSLLSFSTIAIQILCITFFLLLVIKAIYILINNKDKKLKTIAALSIVGLVVILLLLNSVSIFGIHLGSLREGESYFSQYIYNNIFFSWGTVILLVALFMIKDKTFRYLTIFLILYHGILYSGMFEQFLGITSVNQFFVTLRTAAAIEHILLLYVGFIVLRLFELLRLPSFLCIILSTLTISYPLYFAWDNIDTFRQLKWLGAGVGIDGYSISRVVKNNDDMVPDLYTEIGDYFNTLEYGNYRLLSAERFPYDTTSLDMKGLIMTSNRIETCFYEGCDFTKKEYKLVKKYFKNKVEFATIEPILKENNVSYILIDNEEQKNILLQKGYELKLTSTNAERNFYLFKLN